MLPALIPLLGGVVGKVLDRILPEDPEKAREAKLSAMMMLMTEASEEMKTAGEIIVAEAKSESWIARNWRPVTMLTFVAVIANNYILAPYFTAFGLPSVVLDLPDVMWDLIQVGLGGYVVGRSVEKTVKAWKEKL